MKTNSINIQSVKTRIGELLVGSFQQQLCLLDYRYRKMRNTVDNRLKHRLSADYSETEDEIITSTIKQIDEYLQGDRQVFDIPILTAGTEFQKSVWTALMKIPFGQTRSYLQIAEAIGNPNAVRAVANANGANAISILIPCHRVIGNNGELVGYGGGLPVKKRLLKLEQQQLEKAV